MTMKWCTIWEPSMGMQMHCRGNHAVVVSVDFATESMQGTSLMMIHSVVQLQGMEVGNVI